MTPLTEIVTWQGCTGWQGCTCSKCGATHNLMVNIPGYICEGCDHYNCLSWNHHQFTHKHPDYGWKRSVIKWAMDNFSAHKEYFKRCYKSLEKLKLQSNKKTVLHRCK